MVKVITKFEVEDFGKWKTSYMAAETLRKSAGARSAQAFQSADNPKMVLVISEWESLEKGMAFYESPALREAQQKSGVVSKPEVFELRSL